jgi:hypothetical protein
MMYDKKSMTLGTGNKTHKNTCVDDLDDPGIPKRSISLIIGNESSFFPFNNRKMEVGEQDNNLPQADESPMLDILSQKIKQTPFQRRVSNPFEADEDLLACSLN